MIGKLIKKISIKRHKIKDYEALISLILCFSFMKTFFYCKIFAYYGILFGSILSIGMILVTFYLTLFILKLSDDNNEKNYKELYYKYLKPKIMINFTF